VIKTRVLDNKMLEKNKISLDIVGTERIFNNIQWQNSVQMLIDGYVICMARK
jgi:hypothetical protein